MKNIGQTIIGGLITIGLATFFGLKDKPTEMGIIVVACSIVLAFINIDKIQRFKGAGFEAEMKRAVEEANATVEQLREVAATSAEVILTDLMAASFLDGLSMENRLNLHDRLICNLKDIGATSEQIEKADEMWKRGVRIIYFRGIRKAFEKKFSKTQADAIIEIQKLLDFENWQAPTSNELRAFIEKKGSINPEIDELLIDFAEFEKTGIINRKNVFIEL